MRYGPLVIGVDYPRELLQHNEKLCCLVLDSKNKVVATAIVEREALYSWYEDKRRKFDPRIHKFLLSTTCIVGEILDLLPAPRERERDPIDVKPN